MIILKVKKQKGVEKLKGLIGAQKAYPISFKTRFGIHTFGLNFPIDVIILDKNHTVIKIAEGLKPNRIFLWNPKFDNVIELPIDSVKKFKIKTGSTVNT